MRLIQDIESVAVNTRRRREQCLERRQEASTRLQGRTPKRPPARYGLQKTAPEARVVVETTPGEEVQVDYGSGPMVRDPQTGKYRRTRLFVFTLGYYSRKAVRLLTFRSACVSGLSCTRRPFAGLAA
jgi:hypothetical protein